MEPPTDRPVPARPPAAARRFVLGFGARELGIAALAVAVLTATGVWWRQRQSRQRQDLDQIRIELEARTAAADEYRQRMAALDSQETQIRLWAEGQVDDTDRTWARERARRFDAYVEKLKHEQDEHVFEAISHEVRQLAEQGEPALARARLRDLAAVTFPSAADFERQRHDTYEAPLAEFSRQDPDYYRAFRRAEPLAEKADEEALRKEIQAVNDGSLTPQLMMKVDLLTAVAAPDDPIVAQWSALASALDYFERPDGATLAAWQRAQHAIQLKDWGTATKEMQNILNSNVRTREPFRAAVGRAMLKRNPDDPAAYPFMSEAAASGDKQARAWVAQEDYRNKRYAEAQRWLEAAVADGEPDAVPTLLELYDKHADAIAFDPARQIGVVERVTDRDGASPAAWLLLGRLYEAKDPTNGSRTKAVACYRKGAGMGSAAARAELARCALNGVGMSPDPDEAREEACQAFAQGERDKSVAVLLDLMRSAPDRSAGAIEKMFEQESVNQGGGYMERRFVDGPGVSQLKTALAQYFDRVGNFGQAARFYTGSRDASAVRRRAELTAVHPCDTCGGTGKIQVSAPCPTCGGKGKQICSYCGGQGFIFVPGTPPCPTCGGTGSVVQDRKLVACAACGGTGKGKGNVLKQDCPHCDHGYVACVECGGTGSIKVTKECPECHGHGAWSLADKGTE